MDRRRAAGSLLALAACIAIATAAPTASNHTALDLYDGAPDGCYYNFQHYGEGDRIMTNEPCLNCTCHNRMLMCYLRVCPFTKPIGQDCTIEKRADQCCPIVTCPDVPVDLLTSTTTSPAEYGATGVGKLDKYGCSINGKYFSEGSKVPPTPNKPCEHCYCIRNMTTCVMQECTLHVDGCTPIYHKDVCCPVRYSCDHPEDEILQLDDMSTTVRPTPGFLLTTTTLSPVTQMSQDCVYDSQIFPDGALIKTEKACDHCYCMKGDIVCVVQECGTPMENEGKNCTALPPREGVCCPDTYICEGDEQTTESYDDKDDTTVTPHEALLTTPARRTGSEGSGYRHEDKAPFTEPPIPEPEVEGSGEQVTEGVTQISPVDETEEAHEYISVTTDIPNRFDSSTIMSSSETITTTQLLEEHEGSGQEIDSYDDMSKTSPSIDQAQTTISAERVDDNVATTSKPESYTDVHLTSDEELVTKMPDTEVEKEFIESTPSSDVVKEQKYPEEEFTTETVTSKTPESDEIQKDSYGTTPTSKVDIEEKYTVQQGTSELPATETPEAEVDLKESTEATPTSDVDKEQKYPDEPVTSEITTSKITDTNLNLPSETTPVPVVEKEDKVPEEQITSELPATKIPNTEVDLKESDETTPISDVDMKQKYPEEQVTTELPETKAPESELDVKPTESSTSLSDVNEEQKYHENQFTSELPVTKMPDSDTNIKESEEATSVSDVDKDQKYPEEQVTTEFSATKTPDEDIDVKTTTIADIDKQQEYPDEQEPNEIPATEKPVTDDKAAETTPTPEQETTVGLIESEDSISSSQPDIKEKDATEIPDTNIMTTIASDIIDKQSPQDEVLSSSTSPIPSYEEDIVTESIDSITEKIEETDIPVHHAVTTSTPLLEEIEKESSDTEKKPTPSYDFTPTTMVSNVPEENLDKETDTEIPEEFSTEHIPSIDSDSLTTISIDSDTKISGEDHTTDSEDYVTKSTITDDREKQTTVVSELTTKIPERIEPDVLRTTVSDKLIPFTTAEPDKGLNTIPSGSLDEDTSEASATRSSRPEETMTTSKPLTTGDMHGDVMTTPTLESDISDSPKDKEPDLATTELSPIDGSESTLKDTESGVDHGQEKETTEAIEAITETIYKQTAISDKDTSPDLAETTTASQEENEILNESRIPGEGDCLVNGVTYRNESSVPSPNKCETGCKCISSILKCDPIICSAPPEYIDNCRTMYDSPDSCCPTYICDQKTETMPPQPHSQMSGTEAPETSPVLCNGDECEIVKDKVHPCTSESCPHKPEDTQEVASPSDAVSEDKTSQCTEDSGCQQIPEKSCEGDNCQSTDVKLPETTGSCQGENCNILPQQEQHSNEICLDKEGCKKPLDEIEQECIGETCRRKEYSTPEAQMPSCTGSDCANVPASSEPVTGSDVTTEKSITDETETKIPVMEIATGSDDIVTSASPMSVTESKDTVDITTEHSDLEKATSKPTEEITHSTQVSEAQYSTEQPSFETETQPSSETIRPTSGPIETEETSPEVTEDVIKTKEPEIETMTTSSVGSSDEIATTTSDESEIITISPVTDATMPNQGSPDNASKEPHDVGMESTSMVYVEVTSEPTRKTDALPDETIMSSNVDEDKKATPEVDSDSTTIPSVEENEMTIKPETIPTDISSAHELETTPFPIISDDSTMKPIVDDETYHADKIEDNATENTLESETKQPETQTTRIPLQSDIVPSVDDKPESTEKQDSEVTEQSSRFTTVPSVEKEIESLKTTISPTVTEETELATTSIAVDKQDTTDKSDDIDTKLEDITEPTKIETVKETSTPAITEAQPTTPLSEETGTLANKFGDEGKKESPVTELTQDIMRVTEDMGQMNTEPLSDVTTSPSVEVSIIPDKDIVESPTIPDVEKTTLLESEVTEKIESQSDHDHSISTEEPVTENLSEITQKLEPEIATTEQSDLVRETYETPMRTTLTDVDNIKTTTPSQTVDEITTKSSEPLATESSETEVTSEVEAEKESVTAEPSQEPDKQDLPESTSVQTEIDDTIKSEGELDIPKTTSDTSLKESEQSVTEQVELQTTASDEFTTLKFDVLTTEKTAEGSSVVSDVGTQESSTPAHAESSSSEQSTTELSMEPETIVTESHKTETETKAPEIAEETSTRFADVQPEVSTKSPEAEEDDTVTEISVIPEKSSPKPDEEIVTSRTSEQVPYDRTSDETSTQTVVPESSDSEIVKSTSIMDVSTGKPQKIDEGGLEPDTATEYTVIPSVSGEMEETSTKITEVVHEVEGADTEKPVSENITEEPISDSSTLKYQEIDKPSQTTFAGESLEKETTSSPLPVTKTSEKSEKDDALETSEKVHMDETQTTQRAEESKSTTPITPITDSHKLSPVSVTEEVTEIAPESMKTTTAASIVTETELNEFATQLPDIRYTESGKPEITESSDLNTDLQKETDKPSYIPAQETTSHPELAETSTVQSEITSQKSDKPLEEETDQQKPTEKPSEVIETELTTPADISVRPVSEIVSPQEPGSIETEQPHVASVTSMAEATTEPATGYQTTSPSAEEVSEINEIPTTLSSVKDEISSQEPQATTEREKISSQDEMPTSQVIKEQTTVGPETPSEPTTPEDIIQATTKATTTRTEEETKEEESTAAKPVEVPTEAPITSAPELPKPVSTESVDDIPATDEDASFPTGGGSAYGQEPDYMEEDQTFGPGTCRYGGKVYVSAQQIPRDDPCDFCFCFRSDIICLQQSCPPPIHGCHEEPIQGFCCPRYECPVSMATTVNVTTTTTTTTTTLPPHFPIHSYKGSAQRKGCLIKGQSYKVGDVVRASSGPCLHCTCGGDGQMKCDPKACTPEPMLRQMIAAAVSAKRRR